MWSCGSAGVVFTLTWDGTVHFLVVTLGGVTLCALLVLLAGFPCRSSRRIHSCDKVFLLLACIVPRSILLGLPLLFVVLLFWAMIAWAVRGGRRLDIPRRVIGDRQSRRAQARLWARTLKLIWREKQRRRLHAPKAQQIPGAIAIQCCGLYIQVMLSICFAVLLQAALKICVLAPILAIYVCVFRVACCFAYPEAIVKKASRLVHLLVLIARFFAGDTAATGALVIWISGAHCHSIFRCRLWSLFLANAMTRGSSLEAGVAYVCLAALAPLFHPKTSGAHLLSSLREFIAAHTRFPLECQRSDVEGERHLATALRRAQKDGIFSAQESTELKRLRGTADAPRRNLLQEVRDFIIKYGRYPQESRKEETARPLAKALRRAQKDGIFSAQESAELERLRGTADAPRRNLLHEVRDFITKYDRYPQESRKDDTSRPLAEALRRVKESGSLTAAQLAELERLYQQTHAAREKQESFENLLQRVQDHIKEYGSFPGPKDAIRKSI